MRTIDFSPLFRHSVGFDRMQRLLDDLSRTDAANAYPPYNIEQSGENAYRISMAVAGFGEGDLDVAVEKGTLTIAGKLDDGDGGRTYLHRGIAGRAFRRKFELADHIEVVGASLANGLLSVDLERRVPEEEKPRSIEITGGTKAIEQKKAA